MKNSTMKKLFSVILVVVMLVTVVMQAGCNKTTPNESTPGSTPVASPEASSPEASSPAESTPAESTPAESTPAESTPAESIPEEPKNTISFDLDGGIDGGNPTVYDNTVDTTLVIPVKPGYDFAGWTGTGLTEATKFVTIAKGTEGNLEYKANWVENGEYAFTIDENTTDTFGKIFFGKSTAAFIVNGEPNFENKPVFNASTELIAQALQEYFLTFEKEVPYVDDRDLAGLETPYEFYFYFGTSDCKPVEDFVATLNYAQYGLAIDENSISLICWTEPAAAAVGNILYEIIEHVAKGGSYSDFVGARYVGQIEGQVGDDVPALDGLDSGTDVGEGAFQVYSLDSTKEIYENYLKKLEAAGYTLHTTNVMNKTLCATYYNEDTVVNVTFAGGDAAGELGVTADRSLRVIIEPLNNTALPSTVKPDDANANVTVTTVTQMYPHNLCIVFQLSNGHFVILDSGNNGTQKALSEFLASKAPDGKPVVEAWIFSHFHQDHIGGFIDYVGSSRYFRDLTVKSVIYNFPSERTYMTAHKSGTDMSNMRLWYTKRVPALKEKGTTFYQARTGQKYYFGNAEIEILWTFEDLAPFNIFTDDTNRTDIGFRLTIEGQTFMLVGDSTEEQFRIASARYGDYLKSDFLQLAHHGSGNNKGTHDLYTIVDADVIFHSRKYTLEETNYKIGKNEKKALRETELVIRSGNYGTATLKLPFKVGDKIESTKTPVDESHTYAE